VRSKGRTHRLRVENGQGGELAVDLNVMKGKDGQAASGVSSGLSARKLGIRTDCESEMGETEVSSGRECRERKGHTNWGLK